MKAVYGALWLAFVGAFLVGELTDASLTDWRIPVALACWFLAQELFCAFRKNGATFSEFTWGFAGAGDVVKGFPVRVIPAWLLTVAMGLRVAATARLIDGHDVAATYIFGHAPLDLFMVGIAAWLFAHFASLGKYRS